MLSLLGVLRRGRSADGKVGCRLPHTLSPSYSLFRIPMPPDPASIERQLADLVQIDSRNPDLSDEGPGEAEAAAYVAAAMQDLGLEVDHWEAAPGRPNVVGVLRGTGGGRSLMWNAHTDTVGVEGMEAPFDPVVRAGRLYGRGAQDMKASLVAHLEAIRLLQASGPLAGDVIVAAVADEEHGSLGTEAVVERYAPDGAIVTEPTDMQLALVHKGFAWIDVTTYGRAAHGSRPAEGVDATLRMGRALSRLETLARSLRARDGHPRVGPPSLHVGQIRGGTAPSVYAARCWARVERRIVPGETPADALAEVRDILDALHAEDDTFEADAEPVFARHPLQTPANARIANIVRDCLADVLGDNAGPDVGASFWTDAALLAEAGTETVVLGPRGAGLHTTEEWVDLASVAQLAEVLAEAARQYCE